MDNCTHLCKCLRCPEEGRLVTKATYYVHRRRYGTRDGSKPPPKPLLLPSEVSQPQRKRKKAGPSAAEALQRLEDMYNEFAARRSAPSLARAGCAQACDQEDNTVNTVVNAAKDRGHQAVREPFDQQEQQASGSNSVRVNSTVPTSLKRKSSTARAEGAEPPAPAPTRVSLPRPTGIQHPRNFHKKSHCEAQRKL